MSNQIYPHFRNTNIVLVETTHPGNIGSSARAMATMGFTKLELINPKIFPSKVADERAVAAKDILDKAKVRTNLEEAIKDCHYVLGLSARPRENMPEALTPQQSAKKWAKYAKNNRCAFLFGTESNGLDNESIYKCHNLVSIPVSEKFSSLNLAAAVQIMCYEARLAVIENKLSAEFLKEIEYPTEKDLQHLINHFEKLMHKVEFVHYQQKMPLYARLRIMIRRLKFHRQDIHILRGFLKEVERKLKK